MPSSKNGSVSRKSAADILALDDIEERDVYVPGWNTQVRIRAFSRRQVAEMSKKATHKDRFTGKDVTDIELMEALTFTEGVVEPKFTVEQYEQLRDKSVANLMVVIKAINDMSGLSEEAVQSAVKSTED